MEFSKYEFERLNQYRSDFLKALSDAKISYKTVGQINYATCAFLDFIKEEIKNDDKTS